MNGSVGTSVIEMGFSET